MEQRAERLAPYPIEPNENRRILQIMVGQVIGVRILREQSIALIEGDSNDERVRLGGFVRRLTGQQSPAELQRLSPG